VQRSRGSSDRGRPKADPSACENIKRRRHSADMTAGTAVAPSPPPTERSEVRSARQGPQECAARHGVCFVAESAPTLGAHQSVTCVCADHPGACMRRQRDGAAWRRPQMASATASCRASIGTRSRGSISAPSIDDIGHDGGDNCHGDCLDFLHLSVIAKRRGNGSGHPAVSWEQANAWLDGQSRRGGNRRS